MGENWRKEILFLEKTVEAYATVLLQLCCEQGPSTSDSSKRKIQLQSRTAPTCPEAIKPSGNCQERAVCLQRQALVVKSRNNYFCLVKSLFEYHRWFSIKTSQISPHNSCYWQKNYSVHWPSSSHYFVSCKSSISSPINFFFFFNAMWSCKSHCSLQTWQHFVANRWKTMQDCFQLSLATWSWEKKHRQHNWENQQTSHAEGSQCFVSAPSIGHCFVAADSAHLCIRTPGNLSWESRKRTISVPVLEKNLFFSACDHYI